MKRKRQNVHISDIALEVLDVNGVEPDYRGEETDISFCDVRAGEEVWR
jgi:hypothetical protein